MTLKPRKPPKDLQGEILEGRWQLAKLLGQGEIKTVYVARSLQTGEQQAVAVLHPMLADEPTVVRAFLAITSAWKPLQHPNLARLYETGTTATPATRPRQSWPTAGSPGVLSRPPPDWKKRLPPPRESPHYASPEQLRDSTSVDPRNDLWALAVVFYELLSGRDPYGAANDFARLTAVFTQDATPIDRDAAELSPFVPFFERAFARDITRRFQSADEMLAALDVEIREPGYRTM